MSGSYLLDTNAIIALLQGSEQIINLLQDADWVGISIISQLEFLAFTGLSEADRQLFEQFLQRIAVVGLTQEQNLLLAQTIQIRQQYRFSLPDAIIVATAMQSNASLVTADQQLHGVEGLTVITFS